MDTTEKTKGVFDTLVLSGGSIKGIAMLGCLQYCYDNNFIENINRFIGTSIGAVICYLLCIGYTPTELIVHMCKNNLLEELKHLDIVGISKGEGALDYDKIQAALELLTIEKIGCFITMKILKEKYGKTLVCCTYNYTNSTTEYLSYENYPDLPCLTAVKMSSNLPLVFKDFKYMGSIYMDGGVSDNFPIQEADSPENTVLGICINIKKETGNTFNMLEYIYNVLSISLNENTESKIKNASKKNSIIKLDVENIKFFNFNISKKEKLDLFSEGYSQAKKYFESN